MTANLKRYAPMILGTVIVLVAVLFPGASMPKKVPINLDKIGHFGLFMVWSLSLAHAWPFFRRLFPLILAAALFGAVTEAIQLFVDDRSSEWLDFAADLAGAVAAYIVLASMSARRSRMDKRTDFR